MKVRAILWILLVFLSLSPVYPTPLYAAELSVEVYHKNGAGEVIPAAYTDISVHKFTDTDAEQEFLTIVKKIGTMRIINREYDSYLVQTNDQTLTLNRAGVLQLALNNLRGAESFIYAYLAWSKKPGNSLNLHTTDRQGAVTLQNMAQGKYAVTCLNFQTAYQTGFWIKFFSISSEKEKILVGNESLYIIKETP